VPPSQGGGVGSGGGVRKGGGGEESGTHFRGSGSDGRVWKKNYGRKTFKSGDGKGEGFTKSIISRWRKITRRVLKEVGQNGSINVSRETVVTS